MLRKMVFNWIGLLVTLTLMLCLCDLVTGYPVLLDGQVTARNVDFDWATFQRALQELLDRYENSIEAFAREEICGNMDGKKQFIEDLKTKLCRVNDFFIFEFVENMCRVCNECESQRNILKSWVGLLYDLDGNGFMDNEERLHFSLIAG